MDNYVLSLKPEALRKFMHALRTKFNSTARYEGKFYRWNTIMRLKAQELANYILRKRIELSFEDPKPALSRDDHAVVRDKIQSLTVAKARKRGIGKTTLSYLQRRAFGEKPFKIYRNTRIRLAQ